MSHQYHKIIRIDGETFVSSTVTYKQWHYADVIISPKGKVVKDNRPGEKWGWGIPKKDATDELLAQAVEIQNVPESTVWSEEDEADGVEVLD